ncbi:MAG: hypothetical protein HOP35_15260 [Nitrospira sp.]|nr:hypothetical protein [Nitrospira sp.]
MIKKDNHPTRPWKCDRWGHHVRYQRRFATREEAQAFEAKILATRGQSGKLGTNGPSGAQTFEAFVQACIAKQRGPSPTVRPSTVAGWESKLHQMPKGIRTKQLHRISEQDCFRYLQWLLNKQGGNANGTAQ